MRSANEIRQQFIDFFVRQCGHTFVPSSSVVPLDDPTLMFSNAGMNQFKDVFLGIGSRSYKRAANTQKCIRAGGKHNDLDDVGKDTYHHTFFEMLGNWSFGDYFKPEAIRWAWELLTEVWGLEKDRLHVTVFEGDPENGIPADTEAADLWHKLAGVPRERIHFGSKKDNFWEMGDTGPCGPCTEVHIDRTPDKSGSALVNKGTPDVIEIWNLVFIQFNRNPDKTLTPLPAQHVDTGMGFERVVSVIQGKTSNYDTDVFTPIFDAIREITKAPIYTGSLTHPTDIAYRVIADHIRTLTFALTDGAVPSNVGRGYVLRSVLRRAERYGWQQFGMKEPFLHRLVGSVVENFGTVFPELRRDPTKVRGLIYDEEAGFLRTLERGIKLFNEAAVTARAAGVNRIDGKTAFDLHTEQGFFIDITEQMAQENNLTVDRDEYNRLFEEFRKNSGSQRERFVITAVQGDLPSTVDDPKYRLETIEATVLGWVKDNTVYREGSIPLEQKTALLTDRTNFYGEQGGQVGDTGIIRAGESIFNVEDTQRLGDTILHIGTLDGGRLSVGDKVELAPATLRRVDIMRNHTATHLLNLALRAVLGNHIEQKGSLVDAEKTRFDFSHDKPLTSQEIRDIEKHVTRRILLDLPVTPITMPLAEAKKIPGVRAVFGEKYPDPVRVVLIGADSPDQVSSEISVEFCGGTHMLRTGLIGLFKIQSQESVAKGVRRLIATTGRVAVEAVQEQTAVLERLTDQLNCRPEELPSRVEALQEELKKLQTRIKKGASLDLATVMEKLVNDAPEVNGVKIVVGEVPAAPLEVLRAQMDRLLQKLGSGVIVFGWVDEEKPSLLLGVTEEVIKKGLKAGELIKPIAAEIAGSGGGRPNMAQAGGKEPAKLGTALTVAKKLIAEKL